MNRNELLEFWLHEEILPFEGWDFSYLYQSGRLIEDQPPWSYEERASELMHRVNSVLDLDTGGGERLIDELWISRFKNKSRVQTKRRFFELKTVSQQTCQQMHQTVGWTAMARMLNLGNILQLVDDRLKDRTLA
jgi:hypothetical protein